MEKAQYLYYKSIWSALARAQMQDDICHLTTTTRMHFTAIFVM